MLRWYSLCLVCWVQLSWLERVSSFLPPPSSWTAVGRSSSITVPPRVRADMVGGDNNNDSSISMEGFLQERYPAFLQILRQNEKAMKTIRAGGTVGCTILAPNQAVFEGLGQDFFAKLMDPRNSETAEKLGGYHVLGEPVTATEIFNAGGLITLEGNIPVERSVSGGFFGIGGKEDGGVTINGAKVVESFAEGNLVVHEVDGLVSPRMLLRYLDQLRIPGSS